MTWLNGQEPKMSIKKQSKQDTSRNPLEDILAEFGITDKNAVYVQNAVFVVIVYLVGGIMIEGLA